MENGKRNSIQSFKYLNDFSIDVLKK